MRSRARALALDVLGMGRTLMRRDPAALARPRVHFPYLHAVPPAEEPAFRRFVEALAVDHTFLPYGEAVQRVLHGPIDKPYAAFSFDDGFVSNVRAARILEEYGARACFFVPTAFIGTALATEEARTRFGFSDDIDEGAMGWADLEDLKSRGHEIGNHTVTHGVLAEMSDQQVVDEVNLAAEELRRRVGASDHFAWPRGRFWHFDERAARAVFEAGHLSCASAERGAHTRVHQGDPRRLCIRRDHEMTAWPLRHSMYFMGRSSDRAAAAPEDTWPAGWEVSV